MLSWPVSHAACALCVQCLLFGSGLGAEQHLSQRKSSEGMSEIPLEPQCPMQPLNAAELIYDHDNSTSCLLQYAIGRLIGRLIEIKWSIWPRGLMSADAVCQLQRFVCMCSSRRCHSILNCVPFTHISCGAELVHRIKLCRHASGDSCMRTVFVANCRYVGSVLR